MSEVRIGASSVGNALSELLTANDIVPGDEPSYQLAKTIYIYHPLGAKIAHGPIELAMSQQREIAIPDSPESYVKDAFLKQWEKDAIDDVIENTAALSRVYGLTSCGILDKDGKLGSPVDYKTLYQKQIAFNVFDPLNTAGSLVLNQDPNAMDFLKVRSVAVNGKKYHPSRTCVLMNEKPIYIQYTNSAFGYVGRSAYQRVLFPLKSFIQTMQADDLVSLKAGTIVFKQKPQGSIVDNVIAFFAGQKRQVIKEAQTYNVISISAPDEEISAIDLQHVPQSLEMARSNILKNIAVGDGMPAQILNDETYVEGFGEGTEDAKKVARYVDRVRLRMRPIYSYMDTIVQYRAWNPDWYKVLQQKYSAWASVPYEQAFTRFCNDFTAPWPNLLTEPDSEKIKVEDVKLKAVIAIVEIIAPALDPENRALLYTWACDCFNDNKLLFPSPLTLAFDDDFMEYTEQQELKEPEEGKPFAANDAQRVLSEAIARLPERKQRQVRELARVVSG